MRAATFFDGEEWRDGVIEVVDGRMLVRDAAPDPALPRLDGVVVGGFTDHHVHLQLVDTAPLATSTLGRVVDLGANPKVVARLAAGHNSGHTDADGAGSPSAAEFGTDGPELRRPSAGHGPTIEYAGAFLTAPGGYPSDRVWAPEGSVREVVDAASAARAVDDMADAGATCIKIASNTIAGPVFGDDLFQAVIAHAAARGLPVVAHAEGPGEAQRAVRLGASRLTHAPFTERLDDEEIATQAASASWISTLAIHDGAAREIALDNVRRFHAAGGEVLYGTDMGNGPTPVGLNAAEIGALRDAGLDAPALLCALAPADPRLTGAALFLPGATPATADPLRALRLSPDDLKV